MDDDWANWVIKSIFFGGSVLNHRVVFREFVFGDERPFASCHASTLLVLEGGGILVAWFGGSREGADDVSIWMSRRDGSNGIWSPPVKVADEEGIPHWNPVLFQGENGSTFLFYKVGHEIKSWRTMVATSYDSGHTWTKPKALVEGDVGGRGPVKNKPIILTDGTWLAPASTENEQWDAFVDISYDQGQTWVKSDVVPLRRSIAGGLESGESGMLSPGAVVRGKGVIQPTLWESESGIVYMLLRSTEGHIYRSDSEDGGRTWSLAYPSGLPSNNSGIDLVRLDSGLLALVYNPVGINWGPRTPLVVGVSADNGHSWRDEIILENGEGEYSYPAIVAQGDMVCLTYTWKRERVVCWKIRLHGWDKS